MPDIQYHTINHAHFCHQKQDELMAGWSTFIIRLHCPIYVNVIQNYPEQLFTNVKSLYIRCYCNFN